MIGKPISPGAHKTLTYYGWVRGEGETYTHPERPGEEVQIKGHREVGGGRASLEWFHSRPGFPGLEGDGLGQLEYHLMRAAGGQ